MKYAFTHIGMMKTASTYMQNLWLRNKRYALSHRGNRKFIISMRQAIVKGNTQNINKKFDLDTPYKKDQEIIISREGFSTSYLNKIKYQDKILNFISETSKILGNLEITNNNLLIFVREPLSWIKSIYIQSIKQGHNGNVISFINNQLLFLYNSLNLRYIINSYSRYFDNILILPFELLKDDEDKLWQTISDRFNVPLVENRMQKLNVSLDLKRVFILSKMNEMSNQTASILSDSSSYKNKREKNSIIKGYKQSGKWVHRRFVEHAKDKEIDQLYDLFNISETDIPADFYDFELPKELIEGIENNYFDVLEGEIEDKYLRSYRKKFIKKLI